MNTPIQIEEISRRISEATERFNKVNNIDFPGIQVLGYMISVWEAIEKSDPNFLETVTKALEINHFLEKKNERNEHNNQN